MGELRYNTCLGDALHRRECTLKNSKPTMIESRKIQLNLNAVNTSREALLAEKEAILSMLGMSSRQPAYAFA
jgi:hypothetical protein